MTHVIILASMTTVIDTSAGQPGAPCPPLPAQAQGEAAPAASVRWRTAPVGPADAPALHALFAACSPETVRLRFFGPVRALPAEYLAEVLAGSPDRHDAVVAYPRDGSRSRPAGLASLALPAGGGAAELGVLVADPWQRQGAARAMLELLLARARVRGVRRVTATVLPGRPTLLRALGRHLTAEHLAYTADGPSGVYKLDGP